MQSFNACTNLMLLSLLLTLTHCRAQQFWGHTLPPGWTEEEQWPAGELNCTSATHTLQERQKQTYIVGVHAPSGVESAWREFNLTFVTYLNEVVGKRWDPPIEFKMAVTEDPLRDWIDKREEVDFMYTDTGVYSCIATEVGAQPLGTTVARLTARDRVYELDEFSGTMTVLASNHDIKSIEDLKGKVIGAQSFSDFAGAQAQFYTMYRNGLDFITDPEEVIFTGNNEDTILGVLDGRWDVGFVRTGLIERTIDPNTGKLIDPSLLKVISANIHVMDNGELFPFLSSTPAFPEWPFFAKPTVDQVVADEVTQAILNFRKHYRVGVNIDACRKAAGNDRERELCETQPPLYFDPEARCDTTRELAELALMAGRAGFHAGFRSAKSHFTVRTMQQDAGFIVKNDYGDWHCERAETIYGGISCPEGHYKVPRIDFKERCSSIGKPCPEGYTCFCKPCIKAFEVDLYQYDGTLRTEDDILHNFIKHGKGCEKMSMCGDAVEQGDEVVFRAYDNRRRANPTVTAIVHIGRDDFVLNGVLTEPFLYEFRFSTVKTGITTLEVFFDDEQIPESPIRVEIVPRNCEVDFPRSGMVPNELGECHCAEGDYDLGNSCMSSSAMSVVVSIATLAVVFILGYLFLMHKRKKNDQVWHVSEDELQFSNPVEVIGQGAFGVVLLAHYRGTRVAIKRVVPASERSARGSVTSMARTGSVVNSMVSSEDKRDGPSIGGGLGDPENGNRSGSMDRVVIEDDDSTASLRALDDLAGLEHKTVLQRVFPFLAGNKSTSQYNSRILSKVLTQQGVSGTVTQTKRSPAQILCPLFHEAGRRRAEFITEMRLLSRLRHPCITTVMGAIMSSREPMMILEYMENGSLYDLLRNETVYTGGDFIIQIVRDIAQGLRFLHASKPPILHRDLKARNILIDSRFRAKVADFGLAAKTKTSNGISGTPYWMAPEYLLQKQAYNTACDIYSFGMILYEIYSRKTPYEGEEQGKILRKVCDPRVNHRPAIPAACPDKMKEIIKKCWNAKPVIRPAAEDLDIMFTEMSASDVEPIIEGNTRVRTTVASGDMLYKLFPRKVADKIKAGSKVEPENHEMVTVFFSDIVQFTDISRKLDPLKVCAMLDRLYLAFDALANKHEVFKVETIGDAWVGVTNLEGNQDDTHVKRIAEFAVDAVAAAGNVLIDEDEPDLGYVHIRVGFHSGHVVSNVIGSLNPRYGLFGDTMNTASRMESNSSSGMIHCSETSAKLLKEQAPDFPMRRRGKVQVKGKGRMTTYWVGVSARRNSLGESKRSDAGTANALEDSRRSDYEKPRLSSKPGRSPTRSVEGKVDDSKRSDADSRTLDDSKRSNPDKTLRSFLAPFSPRGKDKKKRGSKELPASLAIGMDGALTSKMRALVPGNRRRKHAKSNENRSVQFSSAGSSISNLSGVDLEHKSDEGDLEESSVEMFTIPLEHEPLTNP